MTHYLNTDFKIGTSVFTDLENPSENSVNFTASAVNAKVGVNTIPMVRGQATLRTSTDVQVCGDVCPVSVFESVTLSFNLQRGASNLTTLRAELVRLVDKAIADYGFSAGHVPPSSANLGA